MTNSDAAGGNVSRLVNSLNDVRLFSAWLKRVEAAAHESETRLWETMKPEIADIYSGAVQARTFKQLNEPGLTNEQLVNAVFEIIRRVSESAPDRATSTQARAAGR